MTDGLLDPERQDLFEVLVGPCVQSASDGLVVGAMIEETDIEDDQDAPHTKNGLSARIVLQVCV